ncbi:unnamed protein product [Ixodes hexagonus]
MAGTLFCLFALAALQASQCSGASPPYPELQNPALGKYQDTSKCLPLKETWYSLYRNFENDPAFGGMAKCVRFTSVGPGEDRSFPMVVQYGNTSTDILTSISSFEGWNAYNILHFQPAGQNVSLLVYVGYSGCKECALFRNTYIDDHACTLVVPESALRKDIMCCHFVFDLLCGTTPKYYTYDKSCPKGGVNSQA